MPLLEQHKCAGMVLCGLREGSLVRHLRTLAPPLPLQNNERMSLKKCVSNFVQLGLIEHLKHGGVEKHRLVLIHIPR